ncbi:MAG: hypothetical protein ACKVOR_13755, partial [Flavobacteriales bacterium]
MNAMNSKAKQLWSYLHITLMCMYFIVCALAAQAQVVNDAEYFFDTDPGVGNASPITITTPDDEVTVNLSISTTGLQAGRHLLYIRTRGNTGAWSLYEQRMIEILPTIQAAEYFFDIDPGVGNAIPMMVAASENEIAETEVISTIGLGTGMHFLYIRTRDNQGRWSLQQTRMFEVKTIITDAEYFVDNDPGVGNATPVSIIDSENEIVKTFSVNTTGLASGNHHLYIRSRDENGHWSLQESRLFEVKPRIVSAECFVDIDPGVGSATPIAIIADENEISKSMGVSTTGLAAGKHNLYIRTKDASGRWSLYEPRIFEVKPKIVDAEYFVDTDPGLGSATPISIVDSEDEILKNTIVSTIGLSAGKHILCVRTKDASGHWSLQESRPF